MSKTKEIECWVDKNYIDENFTEGFYTNYSKQVGYIIASRDFKRVDMAKLSNDDILDLIDEANSQKKKLGHITNKSKSHYIKALKAENKKLRELVEYLLTMTVHDYDSLAIKQDAKEIYDEILKGGNDE